MKGHCCSGLLYFYICNFVSGLANQCFSSLLVLSYIYTAPVTMMLNMRVQDKNTDV